MEAVTYSIKTNGSDSEEYYRDIELFTNEFLNFAEGNISSVIDDYIEYLERFNLEEIREREEYILELLSFGILWRTYAPTALSVRIAPFVYMTKMGEWRKKHQQVKPLIDLLRGLFITLFLLPKPKIKNIAARPTLEQIDKICMWFEATGEFTEQALRFVRWRAFWGTLNSI